MVESYPRFAVPATLALAAMLAILSASAVRAADSSGACERLATLSLPHTTITLVQSVLGGEFTPPHLASAPPGYSEAPMKNLPGFCRVAATMNPSADSVIKIEVWLPVAEWNGKFQGVGNGGWAGSISYRALGLALQSHYATASTDTGHEGNGRNALFAIGHPEKLIDFGYRAVHEMTVQAKAIIAAYYGSGPRLSYWNGCSTGGRQGLMEAQRFPRDYNGIVAGAPPANRVNLLFGNIWVAQAVLADPASYIPPSKYPLIHAAAVKACDALDGVVDGIIGDPTRCHFDPGVLTCQASDSADCLTSPQVNAARKIYAGPTNPRTGQQVAPGLEPGSELGWAEQAGPQPREIALSYFRDVLFKSPQWDFRQLNFDSDVTFALKDDHGVTSATNSDLRPFQSAGGKLLIYHGWSDNQVAPLAGLNYYREVVAKMGGEERTQSFARLFMVPGMGHCSGGPGTDTFDKVGVLEQWVEHGVAPDKIVAAHLTNGVEDMTRPLCPYPEVAKWKGTGSTTDAANFVCVPEGKP